MSNDTTARRINHKEFFYSYQFTFNNGGEIAAGASASANINIEADSDFICTKITAFATIAGAPQTAETRVIPLLDLQIDDTSSGRRTFNQPLPLNSIAGTAERPFILPTPQFYKRNGVIQAALRNFSASTDYSNVTITLHGKKDFRSTNNTA